MLDESFLDKEFGPGEKFDSLNQKTRTIFGGISPHGGYAYSGSCAAHTYLHLFKEKIPDTVVILASEDLGYNNIALLEVGEWETPLGNLKVDSDLSQKLLKTSSMVKGDDSAFVGFPFGREYYIDVQLPFIKYCALKREIKILPIIISIMDYDKLDALSKDIARTVQSLNKDIVFIGSTDMSHIICKDEFTAEFKVQEMLLADKSVIKSFTKFNPKKVFFDASKFSIKGPQILTTLMLICKRMGANECRSLNYYTSYDKGGGSGPCKYNAGYFSRIFIKDLIEKEQ